MNKRGPKIRHVCPDHAELRRLVSIERPTSIAERYGVPYKTVMRWFDEAGIEHEKQPQRPRGVTPPWIACAYSPTLNKRITAALHNAWSNMKRRTRTDHSAYYRWYKAKGVTFCAEWNKYAPFRAWAIANGYRKGLWLERSNGDGNYEPGNCCWVTRDEQMLNQRHVFRLTLHGVTKPLPLWARELGVSATFLRQRVKSGWTDEQILTTPRLTNGNYRQGVQHRPRGRAAQKARIARESAN